MPASIPTKRMHTTRRTTMAALLFSSANSSVSLRFVPDDGATGDVGLVVGSFDVYPLAEFNASKAKVMAF